ncbi:uncharacterized protein G6M90_00g084960 [Metarhizium brunneum]|uniref:Uncharacterized protein n=1 Tax=Metarhizium brunneum TaxID=500148 RepID=A0A7D5V2B3_9HYPO|nr:hypothetical protein G6M90_00g084960 [Metarhizium brunneum]
MKLSLLLVATTAAAAAVRWANDDELAVMNANRGKVGTALAMPSALEMQAMEVERMFNITPGLLANSTHQAQDRRGEEQALAANQFIRAGGFAMFIAFTSDAGGALGAVWSDCYGAATRDGTATGKECGDKVIAALVKASYSFVMGGAGYAAVLIQGQADPNQPVYELQNQLPPDSEHGVQMRRSADQECANHNGDFTGLYGVNFHLGSHIGAKLSGYAPCGTSVSTPDEIAQGSFGYQLNRAAGDNGAARIQFYTVQDGSRGNVMGGAIVYETRVTDTCPEYISFDGCEV